MSTRKKKLVTELDILSLVGQNSDPETTQNFLTTLFDYEGVKKKPPRKHVVNAIIQKARKLNIPDQMIAKYLRQSWIQLGYNSSHLRKILPEELKVISHTNLRYLLHEDELQKHRGKQLNKLVKKMNIHTPS